MTPLLQLALLFGGLSLLAFGGGASVIPDMHHAALAAGWMNSRQFVELYGLSRLAPGPGSLLVTLIGQKVAGLPGALVATVAMFLPSCLLMYSAARLWGRLREAGWRVLAESALAPIGVGLTTAAGLVLMRGTDHSATAIAVTLAATLLLAGTRLHPLLVLAAAALLGWQLGL
jgi:chromate transporter